MKMELRKYPRGEPRNYRAGDLLDRLHRPRHRYGEEEEEAAQMPGEEKGKKGVIGLMTAWRGVVLIYGGTYVHTLSVSLCQAKALRRASRIGHSER